MKESKYQSKSSLKPDDSPTQENCFHVVVAKWEDTPERKKWSELWERQGLSIVIVCVTVILLIYSIVAIVVSGFDKAKWLFGITMFLWFCMTYMFIRDHCGSAIFKVCMEPVINAVSSRWRYLKWYAELSLCFLG